MTDRSLLAHHESAHAVCAKALGLEPLRVTIETADDAWGRCQLQPGKIDPEVMPLVLLAASAAESLRQREVGLEETASCDADDYALVADLLIDRWPRLAKHRHDPTALLSDPDVEQLRQRAAGIVGRSWGEIQDLADRLLVVGTLEADELDEFLRHVQPDPIYLAERTRRSDAKIEAMRSKHAARTNPAPRPQRPQRPRRPGGEQQWCGGHFDKELMIRKLGGTPERFGPAAIKGLRAELETLRQHVPPMPELPPAPAAVEPAPAPPPPPAPPAPVIPDHLTVSVDEITRIADRPTRAKITHDDGSISYVEFE